MSKKKDTLFDWIFECGVGAIIGFLIFVALLLLVGIFQQPWCS